MKHRILFYFFGATVMASPVAPTGCETVNVGLAYQGRYADYSVNRRVTNGKGEWDLLVSSDGKRLVPLQK